LSVVRASTRALLFCVVCRGRKDLLAEFFNPADYLPSEKDKALSLAPTSCRNWWDLSSQILSI